MELLCQQSMILPQSLTTNTGFNLYLRLGGTKRDQEEALALLHSNNLFMCLFNPTGGFLLTLSLVQCTLFRRKGIYHFPLVHLLALSNKS